MHWSQLTKRPIAFEEEMRAPEAGAAVDAGRAREVVPPAPLPEGAAHWLLVEIRGPFTRITAGVSEQVPCLNHVSLQMTPLPLLLKRNLTYLNCPKSLASSRISKDTGLSLSATNPPAPSPTRGRLSSQTPGVPPPRRLAASALARPVTHTREVGPPSPWGPFPSPSPL